MLVLMLMGLSYDLCEWKFAPAGARINSLPELAEVAAASLGPAAAVADTRQF